MNFDHLVRIDIEKKQLVIYRVFADGKKELYTYIEIPSISAKSDKSIFFDFAKCLGENILLDSPKSREILGL